MKPLLVPHVRC